MSMRALLSELNRFTSLINEVNDSGRQALEQEKQRYEQLTNNEVWWTYAVAVATGTTAVLTGVAGIGASAVPNSAQLGPMSADAIRATLNAFKTGSNVIGEIGSTVAKGEITKNQSQRNLVDRCNISGQQQLDGARNSAYQQMVQAIQAIMSAKARLNN